MKTLLHLFLGIGIVSMLACNQAAQEPDQGSLPVFQINSMTFIDSLGTSTEAGLLKVIQEVNTVISDSLGYPGAGYTLWKIQKDTIAHLRYLIQGSWPDSLAYRAIHDDPRFEAAWGKHESVTDPLKFHMYRRYQMLK